MGLVHFCSSFSGVATPSEVASFRLLDPLGAVGVDLVGVCCKAAGAGFVAVEPSLVISAMMSNRLFFSAAVRVTLVAATSSSASMSFSSSSD